MLYKRGKVWWIKIKWKGKRIRTTSGTRSKELARRIELKVRNELEEGRWFEKETEATVVFNEAWAKYVREEARHKSQGTCRRAEQSSKNFLPVFGNLTLSEITPGVLSAYKTKRLDDGVKMSTVVKELQFVRRTFSLCKRDWQLTKQGPFEFFRMPRVQDGRVRFLESGQFEKLLVACPAWLKPVVILARYTGMRRSNILSLTWSQVDVQHKVINLDNTKNGERLTIPLSDTVVSVLCEVSKAKVAYLLCPYVFQQGGKPYDPCRVSMAFKRACKRAGIENFRFHDRRHDFASNLVQNGNDLYLVQCLLGHKDGRMTQRYAHLRVERKISDRLLKPLRGGTKGATLKWKKGPQLL